MRGKKEKRGDKSRKREVLWKEDKKQLNDKRKSKKKSEVKK